MRSKQKLSFPYNLLFNIPNKCKSSESDTTRKYKVKTTITTWKIGRLNTPFFTKNDKCIKVVVKNVPLFSLQKNSQSVQNRSE